VPYVPVCVDGEIEASPSSGSSTLPAPVDVASSLAIPPVKPKNTAGVGSTAPPTSYTVTSE